MRKTVIENLQLIADAGGTKTTWGIVSQAGCKQVVTTGISPYFQNSEEIVALLRQQLMPSVNDANHITEIFFYGSGCMNRATNSIVKKALASLFINACIKITDDVYAAARALFGKQKGIACILGTGSSACYFDGKKIKEDRTGLGYILGDEGSGAHLGKKVLQYYLHKKLPSDLAVKFDDMYHTDENAILENVYKGKFPNTYIASFARFLAYNRGHAMIEEILYNGINDFFIASILPLAHHKNCPVGFVGGIAFNYTDIIKELCSRHQVALGVILKEPISGLIAHHKK